MKPITLIGGGLAGLTLGIGLRRRGVPVTVWEAGQYPRHRVCGEFISGRGLGVLERLQLLERFEKAGAIPARTALFVAGSARSPVRRLAEQAICLSRYSMDALLADVFEQHGGELRQNARWTGNEIQEGLVLAAGRRRQPSDPASWFGLKAHARVAGRVTPEADLEMHTTAHGYVGINRVDNDAINVCGLFRARPGLPRTGSKSELLRGRPGSALYERLGGAQFIPGSFCSVAGFSLAPHRARGEPECRIGDALTMTPPVTGNGMSIAFESAEIAVGPLAAYSQGKCGWGEAQETIACRCDAAFEGRLKWASWLHWLMCSPLLRGRLGSVLLSSDWLWRVFFDKTR